MTEIPELSIGAADLLKKLVDTGGCLDVTELVANRLPECPETVKRKVVERNVRELQVEGLAVRLGCWVMVTCQGKAAAPAVVAIGGLRDAAIRAAVWASDDEDDEDDGEGTEFA